MSGRIHSEDRRELFWVVPTLLAALVGFGYVTRKLVFTHWFTTNLHLWGNPEGIGFLWGFLGFVVLMSYILFFWTGMYAHVTRATKMIGLLISLVLTAGLFYGVFSYFVQIRRVYADDRQRFGYILGSGWVWILIGTWKLGGMWLKGQRLKPLRGRFKPQPNRIPQGNRAQLFDQEDD